MAYTIVEGKLLLVNCLQCPLLALLDGRLNHLYGICRNIRGFQLYFVLHIRITFSFPILLLMLFYIGGLVHVSQ